MAARPRPFHYRSAGMSDRYFECYAQELQAWRDARRQAREEAERASRDHVEQRRLRQAAMRRAKAPEPRRTTDVEAVTCWECHHELLNIAARALGLGPFRL